MDKILNIIREARKELHKSEHENSLIRQCKIMAVNEGLSEEEFLIYLASELIKENIRLKESYFKYTSNNITKIFETNKIPDKDL